MEREKIDDQNLISEKEEAAEEACVNNISSSQKNEDASSFSNLVIDNIESDIKMNVVEEEEKREIMDIVNQENSVLKIASSLTIDSDQVTNAETSAISVVSEINQEKSELTKDPESGSESEKEEEEEPSNDMSEFHDLKREDSTDKLISILEGKESSDVVNKEDDLIEGEKSPDAKKEEEMATTSKEVESADKKDAVEGMLIIF